MADKLEIIISGKVIHGEKYGRKLGFPTANLDRRSYARRRLKVRFGIYAGTAELPSAKRYQAAIVIGPIDNKGLPKIEAHLLNFKGNLYGKTIIISLQKYIRPFEDFKTEENLKGQIIKDIKVINKLLV